MITKAYILLNGTAKLTRFDVFTRVCLFVTLGLIAPLTVIVHIILETLK